MPGRWEHDSESIATDEWTCSYDAENRLTEIEYQDGSIIKFLYDGDGKRVARLNADNEGTIYIGNYFESEYPYIEDTRPPLYLEPLIPVVSGLCEAETESCAYLPVLAREAELRPFPVKRGTSYYYADGQRIAMRSGSETYLLFGDHLASSILLVRGEGTVAEKAYYLPWGGTRGDETITSTAYAYTGQMREGDIYYYGARWPKVPEAKPKGFDPDIGRFMQADTIVPLQVQGTQAFDRYAYVNNNPLRFTDPSGNRACDDYYGGGCNVISPPSPNPIFNISVCGLGDSALFCGQTGANVPLSPYLSWNGQHHSFYVQGSTKADTSVRVVDYLRTLPTKAKVRFIGHSAGADALLLVLEQLLGTGLYNRSNILGVVLLDTSLTSGERNWPGANTSTVVDILATGIPTAVFTTIDYDDDASINPSSYISDVVLQRHDKLTDINLSTIYLYEGRIQTQHALLALSVDYASKAWNFLEGK